jgi:hemolysin activation/secretion protein
LFGKKNIFGLTAFVDGGRLWTDYHSAPEFDGTDLDLKYGIGSGLRLAAGKSFVLRLDAAWSKEARPLAAYLASGQMF